MTNETELRDRIADVIAGEEEHPHPRGYTAHAQAIIDELGLRVEGQMGVDGEDPIWEERVAGKWEWEKQ